MAVTINPPTITDRAVTFTWSSSLGGTPTFYVYANGLLVQTSTATSWTWFGVRGRQVVIEVFDVAPPHTPAAVPAGQTRLCWYEQDGVEEWSVEQMVAGVWTEVLVLPDTDNWFYTYLSDYLADGAFHRFRVRPVFNLTHYGEPLEFGVFMVRHPDTPAVDYTYNSGPKTLTIAAA